MYSRVHLPFYQVNVRGIQRIPRKLGMGVALGVEIIIHEKISGNGLQAVT